MGIAGGKEKCEWLEKDLGIKAIDYKSPNFHEEFKKVGYLDVFCQSEQLIRMTCLYMADDNYFRWCNSR